MFVIRDSFDDRFGDDMFELIISYLPIEDKFRYESVSKRFQRLIYNKQKYLIIDSRRDHIDGLSKRQLFLMRNVFRVNLTALKALLNKCKSIVDIEMDDKWIDNKSDVLNTIVNNCHYLTAIRFDFNEVNKRVLNKFIDKFGQQLRHISDINHFSKSDHFFKLMAQILPNLSSISTIGIDSIQNQILSEKLVKINDLIVFDANQNKFQLISDKSLINLKFLNIFIQIEAKPEIKSIEPLSQLKDLRVLKISAELSDCGSDIWTNTIKSIANNCLHLHTFWFNCFAKKQFNTKQCFESIAHFSGLKELSFISKARLSSKDDDLDLKCLKNCKNLLALDLRFHTICDETFEGIQTIVPNLRQLTFESTIRQTLITDRALENLSQLKGLQHIEIIGSSKVNITESGVDSLINSCNRFKTFRTGRGVLFAKMRQTFLIKDLNKKHPNIELDINYCNH